MIAVAVVIAVFIAAAFLLPLREWLDALQSRLTRLGPLGAAVFVAVYVLAALFLVPGSVLTAGAGLAYGVAWGTLLAWTAATIAAALAFLIARHVARPRVETLARKDERFAAIRTAIREQGWKVVVLLRLSPLVPYAVSNYLYGLAPLSFWPYVLASAAGMLPGTLLYVYLGAAGKAAARGATAQEWLLFAAGLLATGVVTVLLTRTARRHLRLAT